MKNVFLKFLHFLGSIVLPERPSRQRMPAGDESRHQYELTTESPEGTQVQLKTIYTQDPVLAAWSISTPREQQIIALVCLGQRNNEIADLLDITPGTVKSHLENIYFKLKLRGRSDVRLFFRDWDFQSWWMDQHMLAVPPLRARTHG